MHHTLEIQEILLNIFCHCFPGGIERDAFVLAALARTCRAFKEPALDLLWKNLEGQGLSPLFYCLSGATRRSSRDKFSFVRPPTKSEWDNLRTYTRRVWSVRCLKITLDEKLLGTFWNPPTTELLFPNLRSLWYNHTTNVVPLLQMPLPSLISLDISCSDTLLIRDNLQSLPKLSPNVKVLFIGIPPQEITANCEIGPNYFCQWQHLQDLLCTHVVLDVDSLVQLSQMPSLTSLGFTHRDPLPVSRPLCFTYLHQLVLCAKSLAILSNLLSQVQLPVIMNFYAIIDWVFFGHELESFFSSVEKANASHTIRILSLASKSRSRDRSSFGPLLVFDNLRPCMAFSNLRRIGIDIDWEVGLTNDDLLTLASAWPLLEELEINVNYGWCWPGITPNGLLRLLRTCPLLNLVSLTIDTESNDDIPRPPEGFGLTLPHTFFINVLDSPIEPEVMPDMTAFFVGIASHTDFALISWSNLILTYDKDSRDVYYRRWKEVCRQAKAEANRHS